MDTDVVVVGAGPVGLLLAGDLCAGGARVTVLERLTVPTTESRASTLHARTMDVLAERGVLEVLGELPSGGPGHFGGIRLDLTAADPGHRFAGQWKCPQAVLEQVLGDRAVRLGARVLRGRELTDLGRHEDHVVAVSGTDRISAAYLVGCDGEESSVRVLAGFDFPGEDATLEMLRADVEGLDIPDRRFERHPDGLATAHRWPDGSTRVMVHVFGTTPSPRTGPPTFGEVVEAWAKVTGEDIGGGRPTWLNAFGNTRRQAATYRRGRVLLAGDAAHRQMPVGGQALNLGLQDAAELGQRLLARLAGGDDGPLERYDAVRRAVGARTLTNIQAQALLLLGGPEVEPLREVFGELMRFDAVRAHLAGMVSGLDTPRASGLDTPPGPRDTPQERTTMGKLEGKTALVTGASRGIGRATAQRLAEEGALVAVHYASNDEAAAETVALIEKDGGRAFAVRAELGVPGDVHELFLGLEQGLRERTGTTTLDIVVNNAAAQTAAGLAPEDVTPEDFDRLMAVNAKAPFFIVQRASSQLADNGRIINISSGVTRVANPEQLAYSMSKGAIEQLSLHMARHLAPRGITVNSVAPGITDNGSPVFDVPEIVEAMSQLSAFKQVAKAQDVANVVAFLATEDARWITGAFIDASGGTLLG
ncbi:NAD(P)-dependent dehydrogenase (short-subunit alcohol dehydrogenase family) [Saccharothrix carnea]|uniref:NAD(P)-dependent dehydrogenase (Short-subunit alcohol dehydrogenase family) n=1 Tax=Saccharothrix carnea TaxID=1280637 RepID=A0A2P8HIG2_SACCR|nr:SDR family oxidoreductase [Saccharothrix carnea]PSL46014.1 NAD(P)-dependent dehydrogenase (short-subunit alcohol dehydrogenase family) [Saccharothrix carnea]